MNLPIDELENELPLVYNAFANWTVNCMNGAGVIGIGFLDILVLQILCQSNGQKRLVDICLILQVKDQHTVSYSLKKLVKEELVESQKKGKTVLFTGTSKGQECFSKFRHRRRHCLAHLLNNCNEPVAKDLSAGGWLELLKFLGKLYDQAARLNNSV
jgi:predicted MarR family transcription regulator